MFYIKSIKILIALSLTLCLFCTSCEWKEYNPNVSGIENISFSQDIIPIFNQSCNSIGCHNNGGIAPNLSAENAFQDLRNKNMLDLDNPPNSVIYKRMTDVQNPMPISGILSEKIQRTILVWIEEGAKDN